MGSFQHSGADWFAGGEVTAPYIVLPPKQKTLHIYSELASTWTSAGNTLQPVGQRAAPATTGAGSHTSPSGDGRGAGKVNTAPQPRTGQKILRGQRRVKIGQTEVAPAAGNRVEPQTSR